MCFLFNYLVQRHHGENHWRKNMDLETCPWLLFYWLSESVYQRSWAFLCYLSESEVARSCPTFCNSMECGLPRSSVHGIFQARILEWVAISFSRGSSQPRDRTQVSHIGGRRFTVWATREAQVLCNLLFLVFPHFILNSLLTSLFKTNRNSRPLLPTNNRGLMGPPSVLRGS